MSAIAVELAPSALPTDAEFAAGWQRIQSIRKQNRAAQVEVRTLKDNFVRVLHLKQQELVRQGCKGEFASWLRSVGVPVATAYRLIDKHLNPRKSAPTVASNLLSLKNEKVPMPPPVRHAANELLADVLSFRLTYKQAIRMNFCLHSLRQAKLAGAGLTDRVVALIASLTPPDEYRYIQQGVDPRPELAFTLEQCVAQGHLKID